MAELRSTTSLDCRCRDPQCLSRLVVDRDGPTILIEAYGAPSILLHINADFARALRDALEPIAHPGGTRCFNPQPAETPAATPTERWHDRPAIELAEMDAPVAVQAALL